MTTPVDADAWAVAVSEQKQPTCPFCGSWPEVFLPTQAFCSNGDCECFLWNPLETAVANVALTSRAEWTEREL